MRLASDVVSATLFIFFLMHPLPSSQLKCERPYSTAKPSCSNGSSNNDNDDDEERNSELCTLKSCLAGLMNGGTAQTCIRWKPWWNDFYSFHFFFVYLQLLDFTIHSKPSANSAKHCFQSSLIDLIAKAGIIGVRSFIFLLNQKTRSNANV